MRRKIIGHLMLGLGIGTVGCYDLFTDPLIFRQEGNDHLVAAGGSGGEGGTTTIDPGCIPSQSPNPVHDECGVFVSSSMGKAGNDGSKDAPFATIADALTSPKTGPIYLCAETFAEPVQIGGGVTIYGGLDCADDWRWIGDTKKTEISPDAGEVPLVLEPEIGVKIEDVAFRAKDAVEPGDSSIAIIATAGAELGLTRCDVEAGNAKDGAAGEAFAADAAAGMMGNPGEPACSAAIVLPGAGVTNACDEADPNDNSISGAGGIGQESSGGAGTKGQPGPVQNGGIGEDDVMACTPGAAGDDGAPGISGSGAQGLGTLTASGYSGVAGNPGEKGKPAQGGGGGGGAKGGSAMNQCPMAANAGGASGGSGGAGGCGGAGGKGGGAGGASIGVVSLGATLTFVDVKITAKNAGNGGNGGNGQNGGMGGPGGMGGSNGGASMLKSGCSGGPGGKGGNGGKGGGGTGGHSIGIAFTGDAPSVNEQDITVAVKGGDGGTGEGDTGKGAAGVAQKVRAFDDIE